MKRILALLLILSLCACSALILEPAEPEVGHNEAGAHPLTKSGGVPSQPSSLSDLEVLHFFQTDHKSILIQHVVRRDSVFVQTLTEEDMQALHITEEEQAFGAAYLVQLNELTKNR